MTTMSNILVTLEQSFSTSGPQRTFGGWPKLSYVKTVVSYTIVIKFTKSQPLTYASRYLDAYVTFNTIIGMTETKKLQKSYDGPPKCLY
jgi:hypothetical protein